MIVNKELFFDIQKKYFNNIPFNQTKEWLESFHEGNNIFLINDIDNPEIICWGKIFNRTYIGKHLVIEGKSFKTNSSDKIKDFFKSIVLENYAIIEISDNDIYSINYEIGIRQSGFIRPILTTSPITLIINTQEKFNFHRNWNRNVRKAINFNYSFEIIDQPTDFHIREFVNIFNQLKARKGLNYILNEKQLKILLNNNCYKLFFIRDNFDKIITGRIIYIHGNSAYDVFAANSNEGIKNGAAYLIQEKILNYLRNNGTIYFDYGRISPSNDEMNNIYLAKMYSGGVPVLYNGNWCYSKNKYLLLFFEIYKLLIIKAKRY